MATTIENIISGYKSEVRAILDKAKRENRANLTADEGERSDRLFERIETAQAIKAENDEYDARARDVRPNGGAATRMPKYDEVARVGSEARTYHRGNDPRGQGFLRDVCRSFAYGDSEAHQRLARHMAEERVERGEYLERAAGDATTATFGGLVVPQYLVDLTAPGVAARRPFADLGTTKHPLPAQGMTFTIPAFSTATSVALQASQLTTVSATSIGETDITLAVQTAAGSQNVSRQAIDRGTGIDEWVLNDLFSRYATTLDSTLLNAATHGLSTIALGTLGAYADTQPTGAKLFPKILAAASGVEQTLLGKNADFCVMHSRRWAWLSKEMTATWPLINSQGIPPYTIGVADPEADYQPSRIRGVLPNGLAVIVDNNVTTTANANQDEMYLVAQEEAHLFEDANAPAFIRCEQPNAANLGVLLVVYGYFAFTFERYPSGAFQKVGGTGLTTPTF
jgi:hypothetical protein